MSESEKEALIVSLSFLTGKGEWWFEGKTQEELIEMYDDLTKIY